MSFTYSGFKGGKNCVQFYGSGGVEMIMKKNILWLFLVQETLIHGLFKLYGRMDTC